MVLVMFKKMSEYKLTVLELMEEFYPCYDTSGFLLSKYLSLIHGNYEHSGVVNYYYLDTFVFASFFLILWIF